MLIYPQFKDQKGNWIEKSGLELLKYPKTKWSETRKANSTRIEKGRDPLALVAKGWNDKAIQTKRGWRREKKHSPLTD